MTKNDVEHFLKELKFKIQIFDIIFLDDRSKNQQALLDLEIPPAKRKEIIHTMKSPFTGKNMRVHKEPRTLTFRKEKFEILFHCYKCEDTGEQFEDETFAQLNYTQVINQYRYKNSIPFPDQIVGIREKYGLSAAKMSEILGFGINSYRQYEGGEVPCISNARLIQLAEDPHEFGKLVNMCNSLDNKQKEKYLKKVQAILEEQKTFKQERYLEAYFQGQSFPGPYTGYKKPDLAKFTEMIIFFAEKIEPWKTKLNKLLFYSDFGMHKKTGFSISGLPYKAIPMGPVPNNYNGLFEYISNKADIIIESKTFSDEVIGEQFLVGTTKTFNNDLFTEKELEILENVSQIFKDTNTREIIELSHQEKAWIENHNKKSFIDYTYSFDLINYPD